MFACYNANMQRIPHVAELAIAGTPRASSLDGRYSMRLDPCDGREPITCALLDYSVTGVRLQLPEDMALPGSGAGPDRRIVAPRPHRLAQWHDGRRRFRRRASQHLLNRPLPGRGDS